MRLRDIDRAVAVALGWGVGEYGDSFSFSCGTDRAEDYVYRGDAPTYDNIHVLGYYSTDIAAAIGALEEFCRKEVRIDGLELDAFSIHHPGILYVCDLYEGGSDDAVISESGDTIPLAICNAILSASKVGAK